MIELFSFFPIEMVQKKKKKIVQRMNTKILMKRSKVSENEELER